MLEKKNKIDKIEILEDGTIQLKEATVILEDGEEIGRKNFRRVLHPGETEDLPVDTRFQAVKDVVWTKDVVDTYKAAKQAREAENNK
jgi:hypothetical protein